MRKTIKCYSHIHGKVEYVMDNIAKYRINRNWIGFLSLSSSFAILGVLISLALSYYSAITGRLSVIVAASNITPLEQEIYGYYALNGRWPDSPDELDMLQDEQYQSGERGNFILEKGSLHVTLVSQDKNVNGKVISFRKATFHDQQDTPTLWLCGYQPIPDGMIVDVKNRTNLDIQYMTSRCK